MQRLRASCWFAYLTGPATWSWMEPRRRRSARPISCWRNCSGDMRSSSSNGSCDGRGFVFERTTAAHISVRHVTHGRRYIRERGNRKGLARRLGAEKSVGVLAQHRVRDGGPSLRRARGQEGGTDRLRGRANAGPIARSLIYAPAMVSAGLRVRRRHREKPP
jgi:hypothetical protein